MEEKFTLADLFRLVPAITVHEGVKIMEVIDGFQRQLDTKNTRIEELEIILRIANMVARKEQRENPNALNEMQIVVMKKSLRALRITPSPMHVRIMNVFDSMGISAVWELCEKTENKIKKTKRFGPKSLHDLQNALDDLGVELRLGMTFDRTIFTGPPPVKTTIDAILDDFHPSLHLHAP